MSEREKTIQMLALQGIDSRISIELILAGYEKLKKDNKLYSDDISIPIQLIRYYYLLNPGEVEFNNIKSSFVRNYVKNESELEGINSKSVHAKSEMEGLYAMYEYIFSGEVSLEDYEFNIYDLNEFHRRLFSATPYSDGGRYRQASAYLKKSKIELCDSLLIPREMYELDKNMVQPLIEIGKYIKYYNTITVDMAKTLKILAEDFSEIKEQTFTKVDALLLYLNACVVMGCKMIKIHPYHDGNGRSVRGFMNKLLTDVGLPPTYVKVKERDVYQSAMDKAIREKEYDQDYTEIKNFYIYKVCDSIIELDIKENNKKQVVSGEIPKQFVLEHPNSVN